MCPSLDFHVDKPKLQQNLLFPCFFSGDKRLHKRDTGEALYEIDDDDEDDLSDDSEHMGKAVLLMSLGNGAMLRSRDHLLRHAQPNTGHHIWRRAALRALAQFPCEEVSCCVFQLWDCSRQCTRIQTNAHTVQHVSGVLQHQEPWLSFLPWDEVCDSRIREMSLSVFYRLCQSCVPSKQKGKQSLLTCRFKRLWRQNK